MGGIAIGPIADKYFKARLKMLLLILGLLCMLAAMIFMFNFQTPFSDLNQLETVATLAILKSSSFNGLLALTFFLGFFQGSIVPVSYELCAEMCYPVSESVSSAVYQFFVNFGQLMFLLLPFALPVQYFTAAMVLGMFYLILVVTLVPIALRRSDIFSFEWLKEEYSEEEMSEF